MQLDQVFEHVRHSGTIAHYACHAVDVGAERLSWKARPWKAALVSPAAQQLR
jgi:hypothetical protein